MTEPAGFPGAVRALECAFFGGGASFHHIGLAVSSISEACASAEILPEPRQGVRLTFLELHGITVELLEPLSEDSPVARSLRQGVKLLHLCFEVPDLGATLKACRSSGFHQVRPPAPADVYAGRRVAWVFSNTFGLFELLEKTRGDAGPT